MINLFFAGLFFAFTQGNAVNLESSTASPIILEDDILMLVQAGSPIENITDIGIYSDMANLDGTAEFEDGCDEPTCWVDISTLSNGTYTVEVITDANNVYLDVLEITSR